MMLIISRHQLKEWRKLLPLEEIDVLDISGQGISLETLQMAHFIIFLDHEENKFLILKSRLAEVKTRIYHMSEFTHWINVINQKWYGAEFAEED